MQFTHNNNKKSLGFTIVEVLIIVPIVVLFIGGFITAIVSVTGDAIVTQRTNDILYTANDSLSQIEQDVKLSNTFLIENSFAPTSPQGYDNSTSSFRIIESSSGAILILSISAINKSPNDPTRQLLLVANQPNSCSSTNISSNESLKLNVVYFSKDSSLFRRVIIPQNVSGALSSAICDGTSSSTDASKVWQLPTCDSSYINGTTCRAEDTKLLDGSLDSVYVNYFVSSDSFSPISNPDADDLSSATTVSVLLNLKRTVAGREITHTAEIRATKLNVLE
jgi:hypothetical protein